MPFREDGSSMGNRGERDVIGHSCSPPCHVPPAIWIRRIRLQPATPTQTCTSGTSGKKTRRHVRCGGCVWILRGAALWVPRGCWLTWLCRALTDCSFGSGSGVSYGWRDLRMSLASHKFCTQIDASSLLCCLPRGLARVRCHWVGALAANGCIWTPFRPCFQVNRDYCAGECCSISSPHEGAGNCLFARGGCRCLACGGRPAGARPWGGGTVDDDELDVC